MNFSDILDDNERQALIAFNASDTMKQAVKKVLLAGIYDNGTLKAGKPADPLRNTAFYLVSNMPEIPNEQLGEELRAVWQGINALESAFKKISEFKLPEKAEKKLNQAR